MQFFCNFFINFPHIFPLYLIFYFPFVFALFLIFSVFFKFFPFSPLFYYPTFSTFFIFPTFPFSLEIPFRLIICSDTHFLERKRREIFVTFPQFPPFFTQFLPTFSLIFSLFDHLYGHPLFVKEEESLLQFSLFLAIGRFDVLHMNRSDGFVVHRLLFFTVDRNVFGNVQWSGK